MIRFGKNRSKRPKRPFRGHMPGVAAIEGRKLSQALMLVALITLAGTIGFSRIEGWELWRSFYFTLITITTVGYGDEGLGDEGKKFASVLLICGVTSASYAFTVIIQSSVAAQYAWRKRMNKQISKIKDHTIVCGFGRLGSTVCERLLERNSPFVVIEKDSANFRAAAELGYLAIRGVATEDGNLQLAGVGRAKHIVAAVDSFAENLVITLESREHCPEAIIIVRAERDEDVRKLRRAGADRVLCLFRSGGNEAVDLITRPRVADFIARASVADGGFALAEVCIQEHSELVGMTLAEFGRKRGSKLSFVALERPNVPAEIPPRGNTIFACGDRLIVAGDPQQLATMSELAEGRKSAA